MTIHRKIWEFRIPFIMFMVASVQLVQVQSGLNRWKGGGYGMYSEIHYNNNEVWIANANGLINVKQLIKKSKNLTQLMTRLKKFPNQNSFQNFCDALRNEQRFDSLTIQIWRPAFNLDSLTYQRLLLYEQTTDYCNYTYKNTP